MPLGPSKDAKVEPPPFIGHSWIEAIYARTSSSYGAISTEFKVPSVGILMMARPSISFPACRTLAM